ncbi:FAD/NAD(P)-binding domain-containing protein [Schizophyllum commune Tattone D]|nr:FAD/NAD(P)-binding domain-containing protein [Schizophyllum commune Tattone D]
MTVSPPNLRIAIVGGGIAGLSLVLALQRFCSSIQNLEITVYEAAPLLDQAGAGLGMYTRTLGILRDLGLEEELAKFEAQDKHSLVWRVRKSDMKEGKHVHDMYLDDGPLMLFHRADFQGMILRHLPPSVRVHLSHRLVGFTESPRVSSSSTSSLPSLSSSPRVSSSSSSSATEIHLEFENGATATCDVLIGADGLRSRVRRGLADLAEAEVAAARSAEAEAARSGVAAAEKADVVAAGSGAMKAGKNHHTLHSAELFAARAEPVWTGTYVYRGLVETAKLAERWPGHPALTIPFQYVGKDRHLTSYPIAQGKYINVVPNITNFARSGIRMSPEEAATAKATTEEVLKEFEDWEDEVKVLIELMEVLGRWSIQMLDALPTYTAGKVILLGDAAHAMSQHLGAGAGQGIEDAFVLGKCFAKAFAEGHADPVPRAAALYNALRLPIGNHVQERSMLMGRVYTFDLDLIYEDKRPNGRESPEAAAPQANTAHDSDIAVNREWERRLNARAKQAFALPADWAEMDDTARVSWLTVDSYNWQNSAFIRERDAETARVLGM